MSPATVRYPPQDINVSNPEQKSKGRSVYQLLEDYKHFSWADKDYDLSKVIGEGAKLSVVVGAIDPKQKTGGALYHRLRRLLNSLVTENLVSISSNWSYGDMLERPGNGVRPSTELITLTNRMQNSAHFARGIPEGWKAVVDHTLGDRDLNAKSEPCMYCQRPEFLRDRAEVAKRTKPARCRECTRKKDPDRPCATCTRSSSLRDIRAPRISRGCRSCPVGIVRTWKPNPCSTCAFWKNKGCSTDKSHCPYRLTVCSRAERKRAAWRLRGIDGRKGKHHWMFVRKELSDGKKIVQPALKDRIDSIQTDFTKYCDDVSKRVIILRHKSGHKGRKSTHRAESARRDMVEHLLKDGNELVLDYQTRFTDQGRTKEEIKKFHDTWREAGENYDGAVFTTFTTDPKMHDSLWDANRNFAPKLDEWIALITKRFRARRRDELITVFLDDLKRIDSSRWELIAARRKKNQVKVAAELSRVMDTEYFKNLPERDQFAITFRIERKIQPFLGLTKDEKRDIIIKLDTRTLDDGTVIRENYRPAYLAVNEFQENGLIHAHITIFGTTWIDSIDQIKADWIRLGQGAMVHAYAMTKNPASNVWEWIGKSPKDSRNRQPVDYLIKYLIKGLYTREGHGLYWALNKRFFTRSRSLDSGWIDYSDGKSVWELMTSLHEDNIPMALKIQNRGTPLLKAWYDAHGPPPGVPV